MRGAVDTHRNALAGGHGAGSDFEGGAQVILLEARADGERQFWGFRRNRLQPE